MNKGAAFTWRGPHTKNNWEQAGGNTAGMVLPMPVSGTGTHEEGEYKP